MIVTVTVVHTFGRSSRKVRAEFEAYLEVSICIVSEVSQTMTSLDHSERDEAHSRMAYGLAHKSSAAAPFLSGHHALTRTLYPAMD